MDSLYEDAELYDLVSPPDATMARFYVEAAGGRRLAFTIYANHHAQPAAAVRAVIDSVVATIAR